LCGCDIEGLGELPYEFDSGDEVFVVVLFVRLDDELGKHVSVEHVLDDRHEGQLVLVALVEELAEEIDRPEEVLRL
jgi:hypothetical protein